MAEPEIKVGNNTIVEEDANGDTVVRNSANGNQIQLDTIIELIGSDVSLEDDDKLFFGNDSDWSLRYNSSGTGLVVRDEAAGSDVITLTDNGATLDFDREVALNAGASLDDSDKLFFGAGDDWSLRYDSGETAFIIRDETTATDVVTFGDGASDLDVPTVTADTVTATDATVANQPDNATEVANKEYVDSVAQGLDWQDSVIDELDTPPGSPSSGDRYLIEPATFGIVGVDTTNEIFSISGDQTTRFDAGETFVVDGSTGNDGQYSIASVNYDSTNDETDLTVNEDITDATADGDIEHADGAWNGQNDDLTEYDGSAWEFFTPNEAFAVYVEDIDLLKVYNSGWVQFGSAIDHGALAGLGDDDHTQYILVDGSRAFSGNQSFGGNNATNIGNTNTDSIDFKDARDTPNVVADAGSSYDIDLSTSNQHKLTLTQDVTLSISNIQNGSNFTLYIEQDGTGGHSVTFPTSLTPGGNALTVTQDAGALDRFVFDQIDGDVILTKSGGDFS